MLMNEANIIMALSEAGKQPPVVKASATKIYACPECGALLTTETELGPEDEVECPDCGAVVVPNPAGTYDNIDEYGETDDDGDLDEAMVKARSVVRNGKKVRLKAHKKRKVTAKQKAALKKNLKKARRKANTGSAKTKRKKSMKVARKLNSNYFLDSQAVAEALQTVFDDLYQSGKVEEAITLESIDYGTYNKDRGTIKLGATLSDNYETAQESFTIKNYDNGDFEIESPVFENLDLSIEGKGSFVGHMYRLESMNISGMIEEAYIFD